MHHFIKINVTFKDLFSNEFHQIGEISNAFWVRYVLSKDLFFYLDLFRIVTQYYFTRCDITRRVLSYFKMLETFIGLDRCNFHRQAKHLYLGEALSKSNLLRPFECHLNFNYFQYYAYKKGLSA